MTRKITTHNATVQTATVEVKTLTVSGRQVTLSVFRQLQHAAVIDSASLKLNGTPWGRVNYFWGESADYGSDGYLHVVWQYGSELRRAVTAPRLNSYEERKETERNDWARSCWEDAYFALAAAEDPQALRFEPAKGYASGYGRYYVASLMRERAPLSQNKAVTEIVSTIRAYHQANEATRQHTFYEIRNAGGLIPWARSMLTSRLNIANPTTSAAALLSRDKYQIDRDVARSHLEAREGAYADLFAQLTALPQLFIAT